jgi:NAD(P)-dependent dehydrogenase (short-subunit alcohol dehydrogenase family)
MTRENQPATAPPGISLAGKVCIVTGASRGIGSAIATLFAAEGAAAALAARDTARLEEHARAISRIGGRALALPVDVADEASVAALFARTAEALGPPDILINAAGAFARAPFADMPTATWDAVLNVNLRGTFLCCREAFRVMPPRGGVIVNFSSLSGVPKVEKFPGASAYVTSKFGVAGLSEALALEGKPLNIRVVAVSPGAVDTEMLRAAAPHLKAGMAPEQMARIALFLVGPDAAPLHGTNLEIYSNE